MKATGPQTSLTNAKPEKRTVKDLILGAQAQFEASLPKHINSERFVRVALVTIGQNPKLMQADTTSLMAALMTSAQLGLEPGVLGQCCLIPYWDSKKNCNIVQFQIGYKGMIELCRRSNVIQTIQAQAVYENDEFINEYGYNESLIHRPTLKDRGELKCFYAYAILKDGGKAHVVLSIDEINDIMERSQGYMAFKAGKTRECPWNTDYVEMGKKTAIKRLLKYLPISIEQVHAAEAVDDQPVDDKMKAVPDLGMQELLAAPETESPLQLMDDTEIEEPQQPAPKSEPAKSPFREKLEQSRPAVKLGKPPVEREDLF